MDLQCGKRLDAGALKIVGLLAGPREQQGGGQVPRAREVRVQTGHLDDPPLHCARRPGIGGGGPVARWHRLVLAAEGENDVLPAQGNAGDDHSPHAALVEPVARARRVVERGDRHARERPVRNAGHAGLSPGQQSGFTDRQEEEEGVAGSGDALALKLIGSDQVRVGHQLAERAHELLGHVEAAVVAQHRVAHCHHRAQGSVSGATGITAARERTVDEARVVAAGPLEQVERGLEKTGVAHVPWPQAAGKERSDDVSDQCGDWALARSARTCEHVRRL